MLVSAYEIEREEKYDNFKKGEIAILISTKAFGMGMDIKNIHHTYHPRPQF
jgi:ATP-dependent DNA helicase RecQ